MTKIRGRRNTGESEAVTADIRHLANKRRKKVYRDDAEFTPSRPWEQRPQGFGWTPEELGREAARHPGLSQRQLAQVVGLSQSTVSVLLRRLRESQAGPAD